MELNRKDLKKITHGFNSVSSRIMRVKFDEYQYVLGKFLDYIDSHEVIKEYIQTGKTEEYNVQEEWDLVVSKDGYMFNFGPSVEVESYQIYCILNYINNNIEEPQYAFHSIYRESKWQDNVDEFNNRVVMVFINNINDYLTGVGIDMGLDESTIWNVSGGQVNIAMNHATINAVQNNGSTENEIERLVNNILDNLSEIEKESADTIVDAVEMIKDEIIKPEPKDRIIRNGIKLLAPMITIANGIPALADNIQEFIDYVTAYIH